MGNGFGAALKSIAGGMATGAGVAMREERLAKYAQDKVDAQNRFTAGENDKRIAASTANSAADRVSRMGLLKEKGDQETKTQLAGFKNQHELVKLKHTQALESGDQALASKLEVQAAGLEGSMKQLNISIGSKEKIATLADATKRETLKVNDENTDEALAAKKEIAANKITSIEKMSGNQIASAEKMLGQKLVNAKEIANLNIGAKDKLQQNQIAATAENLQKQLISNLMAVQAKIASAEKQTDQKIGADLKKLEASLLAAKQNLDKKIGSTEWLKFLDREAVSDNLDKKIKSNEDEGKKNRKVKDDASKRRAIIDASRPNIYGKPDPETTRKLVKGGLLPKGLDAGAPAKTPPVDKLKEGKVTTFGNGQKWTLQNGKQVQVN